MRHHVGKPRASADMRMFYSRVCGSGPYVFQVKHVHRAVKHGVRLIDSVKAQLFIQIDLLSWYAQIHFAQMR